MADLLIPFGISCITGSIVEPEESERGRMCNCTCPGCHMPLISRHPAAESNRIHFAHDSRHPDAIKNAMENCPFNSAIAVKLMAKHIADSFAGEDIQLPSLEVPIKNKFGLIMRNVKVTDQSIQKIESVSQDVIFNDNKYDLNFGFGASSVYVRLQHAGRPELQLTKQETEGMDMAGVLVIGLESFSIATFKKSKETFSNLVKQFVLEIGFREWGFHPRTQRAIAKDEDTRLENPWYGPK
jgi:hypothetical protein